MALVLNSREFAAYHQRLAAQFRPAVLRGVHSGAARAVGYLVQRTRAAPPANPGGVGTGGAVNTGAFVRRWKAIRLPDGAELVNDSPYAGIVDPDAQYGRRPGSKFPPKADLIAWIKRRLLTTSKRSKGGGRRRSGPSADQLAARLYFPVARAIARRGLLGRKILHDPQAKRDIIDFVRADVRRELQRELDKR